MCKALNIDKVRTSGITPSAMERQSDSIEVFCLCLALLNPKRKITGGKYLPALVYAYNATKHESTGFSQFQLVFGRKARLPVDIALHVDTDEPV